MRLGQVTGAPVVQFLSNVLLPFFESGKSCLVWIRVTDVHQAVLAGGASFYCRCLNCQYFSRRLLHWVTSVTLAMFTVLGPNRL